MRSLLLWAVVAGCCLPTGCEEMALPPRQPGTVTYAPGKAAPRAATKIPPRAELAKLGLDYYWEGKVRLEEGETLQRLHVMGQNVYCVTSNNRVTALDGFTGLPRWSFDDVRRREQIFRPYHLDKLVIPADPMTVQQMTDESYVPALVEFDAVLLNTVTQGIVIDRNKGTVYRQFDFDFPANTGCAGDEKSGYFFVASTKGWYYAIRLRENVALWWRKGEEFITSPLDARQLLLYVATEGGTFKARRIDRRGESVWAQKLEGPVTGAFHVGDRLIIVPCRDRRIYAFKADTGETEWQFYCRGPCETDVQVSERTVFQYASGDKLYAVNLANGQQRWANPAGRLVLAAYDGKVYFLDGKQQLQIADEILGTVAGWIPVTGFNAFAPNTTAKAIFACRPDGWVFCIRRRTDGHMTEEDLLGPKARRR